MSGVDNVLVIRALVRLSCWVNPKRELVQYRAEVKLDDDMRELGDISSIWETFVGFQEWLYRERVGRYTKRPKILFGMDGYLNLSIWSQGIKMPISHDLE